MTIRSIEKQFKYLIGPIIIIFQNSLVIIYIFVNWSKYMEKEKEKKLFLFQLIYNAKNLFNKKLMMGNVASCLFHHSNEHYIYFASCKYLRNINISWLTRFVASSLLLHITNIFKLLSSSLKSLNASHSILDNGCTY